MAEMILESRPDYAEAVAEALVAEFPDKAQCRLLVGTLLDIYKRWYCDPSLRVRLLDLIGYYDAKAR